MIDPAIVAAAHADYWAGMKVREVARKYRPQSPRTQPLDWFRRAGLPLRVTPMTFVPRQANGCPVKAKRHTEEEITALINGMITWNLPDVLRREWREWSLEKRRLFVVRIRARLACDTDQPKTPFSSNVVPFSYGDSHAHAVAAEMNKGRNSWTKAVQLRIGSQGVVFEGMLWFWSPKIGYVRGAWSREKGRPPLHHLLWERTHGRDVPAGHVIRHADGNRNNLDPANLILVTRNELVRENQHHHYVKKSRTLTQAMLNHTQSHEHTDSPITQLRRRRPTQKRALA
jgi:hypothetical protein